METFVKFVFRVYFSLFYKLKLVNIDNVPKKGGVLLCMNHTGEMDMFFAAFRVKRLVHYMAKEELFRNPISAWFFKSVGAFPVKRGSGDIGSIKTVLKLFETGEAVGILPEGTRTRGKKKEDISIKPGAAMLAIKGKVPIVPVAVKGGEKLFSKVEIIYGKPYFIETQEGKKYTSEELTELSKDIMHRIYSLMEEA